MRLLCLFVALIVALCLAPPSLAQTAAAPAFPSQFYTGGVEYTSKASPHYLGWLAGAKLLGQGTYSFSGAYATARGGTLSTSMTTGLAQYMRAVGPVRFYGIGAAGMASNSGASLTSATTLGLALNGGVLAVLPVGKSGASIDVLAQAVRVATGNNLTIGLGFGFGSK